MAPVKVGKLYRRGVGSFRLPAVSIRPADWSLASTRRAL